MNRKKAFTYFENNFQLLESGGGWFNFHSQMDSPGKSKTCINFKYNQVKHWVTGYKGSITTFIMEHESIPYKDAKEMIESYDESEIDITYNAIDTYVRKTVFMPYGYKSILEGSGFLADRARKYLINRGFNLEKLDEDGFGYCNEKHKDPKEDYFGRIIIPFKVHGDLKYFIGRDFMNGELRYKNPASKTFGVGKSELLFNEDALYFENSIFVTEGWSDARTMGNQGVATLGWDMSEKQMQKIILSSVENLIFLHDKGFRNETVKAAMKFIGHKNVYVPNLETIMTDDSKDVNELGKDLVLKAIREDCEKLSRSSAIKILNS